MRDLPSCLRDGAAFRFRMRDAGRVTAGGAHRATAAGYPPASRETTCARPSEKIRRRGRCSTSGTNETNGSYPMRGPRDGPRDRNACGCRNAATQTRNETFYRRLRPREKLGCPDVALGGNNATGKGGRRLGARGHTSPSTNAATNRCCGPCAPATAREQCGVVRRRFEAYCVSPYICAYQAKFTKRISHL